MEHSRRFTVVDAAMGPVVYRLAADSREALVEQLAGLELGTGCAADVAAAVWGGCVAGFADVALVVLPGDHAVLFADYGGR